MKFQTLLICLFLCLCLVSSQCLACPSCQVAVESSGDSKDSDPNAMKNLPAAYNNSIYLMISVPYLLFAVFGFMIYRGVKKNEAFRRAMQQSLENPNPEENQPSNSSN